VQTEKQINKQIENISIEDWKRLFDLIPKIQQKEKFGILKGGVPDSKGIIQFPYFDLDKVVLEFSNLMYELNLVFNFDWANWAYDFNNLKEKDFKNTDTSTLLKILTAIIRADRFNEGLLVTTFEDRIIEKVLVKLKNNIMKTNMQELKKKFNTNYKDTTQFAEKARLLQSIWRIEKGYDFEKYGNFLELEFAKKTGANFLTKNIFEIVKQEVKNKQKEGKVIQEPRIWNNLLSSQPLAFNLFGELKPNNGTATKVFQHLFPERKILKVTVIKFEHSPGRKNPKYTGDSSAFDVFVEYENETKENGFFGIEVKYAEDLNDKPSSHKSAYENISKESKIFDMENLPKLKTKPIQQIWRDHLLTLSLFITNNDYSTGDFIYLYPKDNKNCVEAIEKYQETFNPLVESFFKPLTIERLTEVIKLYCKEKWINDFEDRYLKFEKIEMASR
jgi:hypothetical protein